MWIVTSVHNRSVHKDRRRKLPHAMPTVFVATGPQSRSTMPSHGFLKCRTELVRQHNVSVATCLRDDGCRCLKGIIVRFSLREGVAVNLEARQQRDTGVIQENGLHILLFTPEVQRAIMVATDDHLLRVWQLLEPRAEILENSPLTSLRAKGRREKDVATMEKDIPRGHSHATVPLVSVGHDDQANGARFLWWQLRQSTRGPRPASDMDHLGFRRRAPSDSVVHVKGKETTR